jgi:hypothetical protein
MFMPASPGFSTTEPVGGRKTTIHFPIPERRPESQPAPPPVLIKAGAS